MSATDAPKTAPPQGGAAINVALRMRPLNKREIAETGNECSIEIFHSQNTLQCTEPKTNVQKTFTFDHVFDSSLPLSDPRYATQDKVYAALGEEIVEGALQGFNACLFAYGLTGTGKTYTMMGYGVDQLESQDPEGKGMVPRVVERLFDRIQQKREEGTDIRCQVGFLEVYNDRVRDLLQIHDPKERKVGDKKSDDESANSLPVHTHPKIGVYVEGQLEPAVKDLSEAFELLRYGIKMRSVASTNMNATSSRSHTIFQLKFEVDTGDSEPKLVHVNLVDLAGRENERGTAAKGERLLELTFINKSLFELANCVHALAAGGSHAVIPFRNNRLTLLLSDSLHGNSRTAMIAAITPAACAYTETMSTIRFAQAVKTIKTKPVQSNKGKSALVAQLQEEIEQLKAELATAKKPAPAEELPMGPPTTPKEVEEKLKKAEILVEKYREDWESAVMKAVVDHAKRKKGFESMGIGLDDHSALVASQPCLVRLSDDPFMTNKIVYIVKQGNCTVGSGEKDNVFVRGVGILPSMLELQLSQNPTSLSMMVKSGTSRVLLNGQRVQAGERVVLDPEDRLIVGHGCAFRVVIPGAEQKRATHKQKKITAPDIESLSLDDALKEIEDEGSEQFEGLRPYIQMVEEEVGSNLAQAFLTKIHRAAPFVDEANHLTSQLKPHEDIFLRLAVMEGAKDTDKPRCPDLVIQVLRVPSLPASPHWQNVRKALQAKLLSEGGGLYGCARDVLTWMCLDAPSAFPAMFSEEELKQMKAEEITVWSFDSFKARLVGMRDLYDHCSSSQSPSKFCFQYLKSKPWEDPWKTWEPIMLQRLLSQKERDLHTEHAKNLHEMSQRLEKAHEFIKVAQSMKGVAASATQRGSKKSFANSKPAQRPSAPAPPPQGVAGVAPDYVAYLRGQLEQKGHLLEVERETLKGKNKDLTQELREVRQAAKTEKSQLEQKVRALEAKLEKSGRESKVSPLEARVAKLEAENQRLKDSLQNERSKRSSAPAQTEGAKLQRSLTQQEIGQLRAELSSIKQARDETSKHLMEALSRAQQLHHDNINITTQMRSLEKQLGPHAPSSPKLKPLPSKFLPSQRDYSKRELKQPGRSQK